MGVCCGARLELSERTTTIICINRFPIRDGHLFHSLSMAVLVAWQVWLPCQVLEMGLTREKSPWTQTGRITYLFITLNVEAHNHFSFNLHEQELSIHSVASSFSIISS